jgi:hypothetical protein
LSGSRVAILAATALGAVLTGHAGAGPADVPEDRLLPPAQHATAKAQGLAARHAGALRELNADVYHCIPWVEVAKHSIGFFKPRGLTEDQRFLSIRVYVEQDPSPAFAALSLEERAAAMFSRYVGPLLRRMTRDPSILSDDAIDGFTVVLEWLKQVPARGARPVHETIAAFIDKADANEYLGGRLTVRDLAVRARVLAWDGETSRGTLRLAAWDDDFVATYKVKNYQVPVGVTCAAR